MVIKSKPDKSKVLVLEVHPSHQETTNPSRRGNRQFPAVYRPPQFRSGAPTLVMRYSIAISIAFKKYMDSVEPIPLE